MTPWSLGPAIDQLHPIFYISMCNALKHSADGLRPDEEPLCGSHTLSWGYISRFYHNGVYTHSQQCEYVLCRRVWRAGLPHG